MVRNKTIGKRYDGKQSPLMMAEYNKDDWRVGLQEDYDAFVNGATPRVGRFVHNTLLHLGVDPSRMNSMSYGQRRKLIRRLEREVQHLRDKMFLDTAASVDALGDRGYQYVPGGKIESLDMDVEHRGGIPRAFTAGRGALPREFFEEKRQERTQLHGWLREWSRGPLVMEHPQGSSYHHLLNYDATCVFNESTSMEEIEQAYGKPQLFVVERDWAKAFSGYDLTEGDVRMPFDHCCFEFRITGVRVLAFVRQEIGVGLMMFCVYGHRGNWVVDDYCYGIGDGQWNRITPTESRKLDCYEFDRVNKMVWNEVRVASIMVDANVAETVPHAPSAKMIQRKAKEQRAAPRNHFVIDLKKRVHYAPRSGAGVQSGIKQRGHFRRGTWVHYQDPDSGQVQYVNDGGFWLSRTWRHWHFAGDPNNIIEKEYRL